MLQLRFFRAGVAAAALAVASVAISSPVAAQYSGAETSSDALGRNIRVLATDPRNFEALIGAGKAALDMGDVQAAAGFFGRAQELRPNDWRALAGVGGAMVQMGDPVGAIAQFEAAKRAGAPLYAYALDRGMAYDLQGKLSQAQADYRAALGSVNDDEARRRLSLSLAISGKGDEAVSTLQPLLNRRDIGAQRSRAFVLALVGRRVEASQAIEQVMPGGGSRFEPFFRYLPNLSVAERAAAVHLGVFPADASTRIAAAVPVAPPPQAAQAQPQVTPSLGSKGKAVKLAEARPPKVKQVEVKPEPKTQSAAPAVARQQGMDIVRGTLAEQRAVRRALARSTPKSQPPSPKPIQPAPAPQFSSTFSLPSQTEQPEPIEPAIVTPVVQESAAVIDEPTTTPVTEAPQDEGRLSGIDKLLSTIAEDQPPPAPTPKVGNSSSAKKAREAKLAEAKKVADRKIAEAKAAQEKARKEAEKIGVAGTNWIQLAGGSNPKFMATEYKKLSAKSSILRKRAGYVTAGKDYFRLLIGPFASADDARETVNKLAKDGVKSFSWTRTPAQIKIEKLP